MSGDTASVPAGARSAAAGARCVALRLRPAALRAARRHGGRSLLALSCSFVYDVSSDASDPTRRRPSRAPRGERRVAAGDRLGVARRAPARATPERVFIIEGLREGGRQFTFGDLKTARRSHGGRRSAGSACGAGDVVVVAAAELVRGRGAGRGDRPHRRGVEPDHHHLSRARGGLRLPPGEGQGAGRSRRGARRRPPRARRRGARAGARPRARAHRARRARRRAARAGAAGGRPERAAAAVAARTARRVDGLLHVRHHRRSEGRAAHAVDARRGAALSGAALPAVAGRPQPAAVPAHPHRRPGDVRPAAAALGHQHRSTWRPTTRSWRST